MRCSDRRRVCDRHSASELHETRNVLAHLPMGAKRDDRLARRRCAEPTAIARQPIGFGRAEDNMKAAGRAQPTRRILGHYDRDGPDPKSG